MWITVASGKGGTGKTTVAVSLALAAKVMYVDADVEEPNGAVFLKPDIDKSISYTEPIPEIHTDKCTFCGKCADACVYKAIVILKPLRKAMFFQELCHSCGLCSYVCPEKGALIEVPKEKGKINFGHSGEIQFMEGILNLGEASATPLIRGMKKYIPRDKDVVIDAPPGTSCPVVEATEDSDFVLLVAEPTPFGLNDLQLTVDVIKSMDKPMGIVINKSGVNDAIIEQYAESEGVPILGKVPFRREIAEKYSKGIPVVESISNGHEIFSELFEKIRSMVQNEK